MNWKFSVVCAALSLACFIWVLTWPAASYPGRTCILIINACPCAFNLALAVYGYRAGRG